MTVTESLLRAVTLLGLGMTFVFLFLGLLMIAVKLMEKYIPVDQPVITKGVNKNGKLSVKSEVNPRIIAAVTSAVQQYRKIESA